MNSPVVLQVPGVIGYRELVSRTVASICKIACPDFEEATQFRDELVSAVGEAFNNSVIHAYASNSGEIVLRVEVEESSIAVELLDYGSSFDPESVPMPDLTEPRESGMGLFIIRSFVDAVTYQAGSPNCLRMVKRLPQAVGVR